MDETVRLLLRFVARGFYGKSYVLILDAVLLHSVLSEDDLSHLLGIQRKELRALCNKLVDDRLLTTFVQREDINAQIRPIQRTYYYIHFTEAIDSIKWKVHSLVQSIRDDLSADANPQGFICPICKTKYSQLDAIALMNYEKNEFLCSLCNEPLIEDDTGKIAKENQVKYSNLMKQLEPLIGFLRVIDEHSIPENNFESSLSKIIPVQANSSATYTIASNGKGKKMFERNSYLNNSNSIKAGSKSQATLHVSITTNDENLQKEKLALEQEEKRKQNALPTWHEESTIGKALGKLDNDDDDIDDFTANIKQEIKQELKTENQIPIKTRVASIVDEDKEAQDALAAYYEQLAKKAKEDEDEEDDDDDDDDVEFDDVDLDEVDFGDLEANA